MWRERDSSASILVAHSNGQMIRAPWRPSGSRALMTFVQGVKYGLFPPVAFRQWGHARRVRSQRLCAFVCEGAKLGRNAFEGESGVGSPEKVIRLCLDGIGRCVPGPVVFCSRGVSTLPWRGNRWWSFHSSLSLIHWAQCRARPRRSRSSRMIVQWAVVGPVVEA
jgi:hypothetical protein